MRPLFPRAQDGVIDFDEYKRIIAADPGFTKLDIAPAGA